MRRRTIISSKEVEENNSDLGNIILYDGVLGKLVKVSNLSSISKDRYTPVGIVVIPTEHDVYGTGECGVMALNFASRTSPDHGSSTPERITNSLCKPTTLTYMRTYQIHASTGSINTGVDSNLPSDWFTGTLNYTDPKARYYTESDFTTINMSGGLSPYNADGSRFKTMFIDDPQNDFSSKDIQDSAIAYVTDGSWKTSSTISNTLTYVPNLCCWRYSPVGTIQGTWYVPTLAELGYYIVRMSMITDIIAKINDWAGTSYSEDHSNQRLESCNYYVFQNPVTQVDMRYIVLTNTGAVTNTQSSTGGDIRPFMRGTFTKI